MSSDEEYFDYEDEGFDNPMAGSGEYCLCLPHPGYGQGGANASSLQALSIPHRLLFPLFNSPALATRADSADDSLSEPDDDAFDILSPTLEGEHVQFDPSIEFTDNRRSASEEAVRCHIQGAECKGDHRIAEQGSPESSDPT